MPLISAWWIVISVISLLTVNIIIFNLINSDKKMHVRQRELAFNLMLLAEKSCSTKTGHEKFEWVVNNIYELCPEVIMYFTSRESLEQYIQELYFQAIYILDNQGIEDLAL